MSKRDDTRDQAVIIRGGLALVRSALVRLSGSTSEQDEAVEAALSAANDANSALEHFINLRNAAL